MLAVTREHKLALLVGFSLVLIVGVLISDHFSPARNQEVSAGDMSAGTPVKFGGSAGGLQVAAEPRATPQLPSALIQEPPIAARLPEQPGSRAAEQSGAAHQPLEMVMGPAPRSTESPVSSVPEELRNDFEPSTGRFGERLAAAPEGSIPGAPSPDSALHRSTTTVVPTPAPPPGKVYSTGTMARHTVREGDSVYRLAASHYGDGTLWTRLREYNRGKIGPEGEIREGAVIELPPKDVLIGSAVMPPAGYTPPRNSEAPSGHTPPPGRIESPQKREESGGPRIYVVEKGDELGTVAKKTLGSVKRWPEIAALNRDVLPDPDQLQAGMKLRIPAR